MHPQEEIENITPPEKKTWQEKVLENKFIFYGTIVSVFGTVLITLIPNVVTYFTSEEKKMLRDVENQIRIEQIIDSIQDQADREAIEKTFRNMAHIYELMDKLKRELPYSASISIYYTHDSGGVPRSGSPLNCTILYQSNNVYQRMAKDYWQNRPLPEGYFMLNKYIYDNGEFYFENIENYPSIYVDETKEHIDFNNTKSIFGKVIKINPNAVYYLAIGYDHINPISTNSPSLKNIVREYSARFDALIQGKNDFRKRKRK